MRLGSPHCPGVAASGRPAMLREVCVCVCVLCGMYRAFYLCTSFTSIRTSFYVHAREVAGNSILHKQQYNTA